MPFGSSFLQVMQGVLLPVAIFVAAGALLRKRLHLDARPLSQAALYVLSPALVFVAVDNARLRAGDVGAIALFAAAMALSLLVLSRAAGRLMRMPQAEQSALDLTTLFPNTNNLGLPVVSLALGANALGVAALLVLSQIFLVNSVGAYLAGRGRLAPRQSLRRIIVLPSIWAGVLALAARTSGLAPPAPILQALHLGALAYAPVVLLVLGGAIADLPLSAIRNARLWCSVGLRLIAAPALALGLIMLLGLNHKLGPALFLEAAMPAAVNALILAREFEARPEQVGQVIAISTILSMLTLPAAILVARALGG